MKTTYLTDIKHIKPDNFDYILFCLSKDFINNEGVRVLRTLFNGCLALPFNNGIKSAYTVINLNDEIDTVDIDALIKRIKEDLTYTAGATFNNSVTHDKQQLTIGLTRKGIN